MPRFEEGRLAFDFGDRWQHVVAFDKETDYRNAANSLPGTKGVDFMGLIDDTLFLIEVKDFRGYRIENQERLRSDELRHEFAQKVRDSIVCMVGFCRSSSQRERWQPFLDSLSADRPIQLILWLEQDRPRQPIPVKNNITGNYLKPLLNWLYVRAKVESRHSWDSAQLDLVVESLPFEQK